MVVQNECFMVLQAEFTNGLYTASSTKYIQKFKTRDNGSLQISLDNPENTLKVIISDGKIINLNTINVNILDKKNHCVNTKK